MDAKTTALVQVYAKSLVEIASDKAIIPSLRQETVAILEIFKTTDIARFLANISVPKSEKIQIVRLFQESSSKELNNFLEVILQNDREALLKEILLAVLEEMDKTSNTYDILVKSAVKLSSDQKERLLIKVSQKFGIKAGRLIEEVDPSLIGGFILQANNQVIDTSIKQQLQQLKMNLK
ncbi:F0F1 ATP synthase subunit delta [Streptococcus sp.]|nr:F0F1 ATP synthase subunit delta [Streptococcus sp.]MDY3823748.1 F0F1 ATP synthase subunit delta [Streptococcus sp.]